MENCGLNVNPLISIIIPTLQEEKLIRRTLDQFTPQLKGRYSLEVIVSDGGSTDQTVHLSKKRADIVVERLDHSVQNISIGRNQGARVARGEVLIFFNADVIIDDPETFFSRMSTAVRCDVVSAATCNVKVYPEEEGIVDRLFHNFFDRYFRLLNILGMGMGRGECHVIRREMFDRMGGYNETLAAGEDYELFVRLRKIGKIDFVRDITVFESPRRYRKFGYLWVTLLWFLNGLTVFLFHRSLVTEWKPVR